VAGILESETNNITNASLTRYGYKRTSFREGTAKSSQKGRTPRKTGVDFRFDSAVAAHSSSAKRSFDLRWAKPLLDEEISKVKNTGLGVSTGQGYVGGETRAKINHQLYPRLLHPFSDVVCYVTNSPR